MYLTNYGFRMHLGCGYKGDTWALYGQVWGRDGFSDGDWIFVSTPVKLEGNKLTTVSGSIYELSCPENDSCKVEAEIRQVIERGAYERF